MTASYDVVVVGAGPGGYVAAIRTAQFGLSTALIEKQHLGGICLNWGCIPTKAMLKGAELKHSLSEMHRFGLSVDQVRFDIKQLVEHSRSVAEQLARGVEFLMRKNGITVIRGHARLLAKGKLAVEDGEASREVGFSHCILATGARPRMIPGLDHSHSRVWTYFEAMTPDELPESVLVIGAGAVGCEFASLYADLGSQVTLVEMADQILPTEDADVARHATRAFEERGIQVCVGSTAQDLDASEDGVTCAISKPGEGTAQVQSDVVIVAVGVQANIEDLGLEALGVAVDQGAIVVDGYGRTNVVGVYAVGDVAGPPWLAHKASHEATVCVENLVGAPDAAPLDRSRVPACTYTRPQVASVGLTQAQAAANGHRTKIGIADLSANGKALAGAQPDGLVKTVFDADTGELLGVHMIGAEVTEQIQGPAIAQLLETTEQELAATVFPHPTFSEAIHEAVLAAEGRAIHI